MFTFEKKSNYWFMMKRGRKGILFIVVSVASELNDNRKQLQKLIGMVLHGEASHIFISYRDCLTRFGYHYLETICKECGVEIHVTSEEEVD